MNDIIMMKLYGYKRSGASWLAAARIGLMRIYDLFD